MCDVCAADSKKEWLKHDILEEKQQVKVKFEFGRAVKVVDKVGIPRDAMKPAGYVLSEHQENHCRSQNLSNAVFALSLAEELVRQQIEIGVWKGLGTELDAVEVSIVRCCKMDLEIHFSPKIGKFSALSGLLKTLKFPCLLKEVSTGAWSLPGRSQGISGSQSTESLFSPRRQPSKKFRSTEWIQ